MQFVETMLEIHTKYSELILAVFNSDQQFVGALDKVTIYKLTCSEASCLPVVFTLRNSKRSLLP